MNLINGLVTGLPANLVNTIPSALGDILVWNLTNATYAQEATVTGTTPYGIAFNPDGTQFLLLENGSDIIHEYTLSTAWDLDTISKTATTFSVATQENNPRAISYNDDGTAVYIAGLGSDSVHQYTLSTPYTLAGITYANKSSSIITNTPTCIGGNISKDGNHYYALENSVGVIQYDLSTAFDADTLSYSGNSFTLIGEILEGSSITALRGVEVSPDGTKMFVSASTPQHTYQFTLSTPFDVSTATYDSVYLDRSAQAGADTAMNGIFVTPDADSMFAVGSSNDKIIKYTLALTDLTAKIVALIGDSITAQNTTVNTTSNKFEAQGYMTMLNYVTDNRYDFQPSANLGVGGETLSEIEARITSLAALNPDIVFVLGGSNDVTAATTAAAMQTSLGNIRDYVIDTLGAVCVMLTIPPRTQVGGAALSGADQTKLDTVNAWILAQNKTGLYTVDIYSALVSTGTDNPDPTYFKDESGTLLHPNPAGGFVIGNTINTVLNPVYGDYTQGQWKTGTNLLSVSTTTGTGGTADANVTNNGVATGFDIDSIGTADASFRTASKTAQDYQRLQLNVPSGNAAAEGMIYLMGTYTGGVVGDEGYLEADLSIDEVTNVDQIVLECREEGDNILFNIYHDCLDDQSAQPMPAAGEGIARSPRFRLSSDTNKVIRPRLYIEGNATAQALSCDVVAKRFRFVKTDDPYYINRVLTGAEGEFDYSNPICIPSATGTATNLLGDTTEDFWLGSNGTTAAPVVTGTLGVAGTYLASAGTDYLNLKDISTSALRKFHRTDHQGWYMCAFKYEETGMNNDYLFGNRVANTDLGIAIRFDSAHQLDGFQSNGSASSSIFTNDFTFVDGQDYIMFISLDGTSSTDNVKAWINSRTATVTNSVAFQTSTTDSTDTFSVMTSDGTSGGSVPAGFGVFGFAYGTGVLTDSLVDAATDYIAQYRGYGSLVSW